MAQAVRRAGQEKRALAQAVQRARQEKRCHGGACLRIRPERQGRKRVQTMAGQAVHVALRDKSGKEGAGKAEKSLESRAERPVL